MATMFFARLGIPASSIPEDPHTLGILALDALTHLALHERLQW